MQFCQLDGANSRRSQSRHSCFCTKQQLAWQDAAEVDLLTSHCQP